MSLAGYMSSLMLPQDIPCSAVEPGVRYGEIYIIQLQPIQEIDACAKQCGRILAEQNLYAEMRDLYVDATDRGMFKCSGHEIAPTHVALTP